MLGRLTGPEEAAIRAELKAQLHEALDQMDPLDREVLTLRHFEQLTTAETAHELSISVEAAKKRQIRALKRLKTILSSMPEGPGGFGV